MTPEEQRIAIAEACGWKPHKGYDDLWEKDGRYAGVKGAYVSMLPDYLNDLNAMKAAESTLKGIQWTHYVDWLKRLLTDDITELVSAAAFIRAEAFLRTIGKWNNQTKGEGA